MNETTDPSAARSRARDAATCLGCNASSRSPASNSPSGRLLTRVLAPQCCNARGAELCRPKPLAANLDPTLARFALAASTRAPSRRRHFWRWSSGATMPTPIQATSASATGQEQHSQVGGDSRLRLPLVRGCGSDGRCRWRRQGRRTCLRTGWASTARRRFHRFDHVSSLVPRLCSYIGGRSGGCRGCLAGCERRRLAMAVAAFCRWCRKGFEVALVDTGDLESRLMSRRVACSVSGALMRVRGSVL